MNTALFDALLQPRLGTAFLLSAALHAALLAHLTGGEQSGSLIERRPAFVVSLAQPPDAAPTPPTDVARQEENSAAAAGTVEAAGARSETEAGLLSELERYYRGNEVDQRAEPLDLPDVQYPESALAQGIEGRVTLRLLIDSSGVLREASVVDATPKGLFEEVALNAVRRLSFRPAMRGGRPVGSIKLIEVPFYPDCRRTGSCVGNTGAR